MSDTVFKAPTSGQYIVKLGDVELPPLELEHNKSYDIYETIKLAQLENEKLKKKVEVLSEALKFYADKKSWNDRWYESEDGNEDNSGDIFDVVSIEDVDIQTEENRLADESFNGHYTFGGKRARQALTEAENIK